MTRVQSKVRIPRLRRGPQNIGSAFNPLDSRAVVISVVVQSTLVIVALTPLYPVFTHWMLWITGGVAAAVSGAIVAFARLRNWNPMTFLAVTLASFLGLGGLAVPTTAVAGFLPTGETVQQVGRGIVLVWKQALTMEPPFGTYGVLLLLPYVIAWVGSGLATYLATHHRRYSYAPLVVAAVLFASILFGTHRLLATAAISVLLLVISLWWLAWRRGTLQIARVLALSLILGTAAVSTSAVAELNPLSTERVVLRDYVQPPADPFDYPSPLAGFRRYVDTLSDTEILRVNALPSGTPVLRLATMDTYDGHVWTVSSERRSADTGFSFVGEQVRTAEPEFSMNVQLLDYSQVWLPGVAGTVDVEFAGERRVELQAGLYYNRSSETGLVQPGLRAGDAYVVSAVEVDPVLPENTDALHYQEVEQPDVTLLPSEIIETARALTQGADTDYSRVAALADGLAGEGGYSNGLVNEATSRPGHGLSRLVAMVTGETMIGDEEQYAALMALMARSLGIPARVVMGFDLADTAGQVRGENVTAWVEVPFEGVGWVPFYPTPDPDQRPIEQRPQQQDQPQPQVLQPPDPPTQAPPPDPQDRDEVETDSEEDSSTQQLPIWLWWVLGLGLPLILFTGLIGLVVAMKWRRRRRRHQGAPREQVVGAWDEFTDALRDSGREEDAAATRSEVAAELQPVHGESVLAFADAVDAADYGPDEPTEATIGEAWRLSKFHTDRGYSGISRGRRIRAALSPRSLRYRTR